MSLLLVSVTVTIAILESHRDGRLRTIEQATAEQEIASQSLQSSYHRLLDSSNVQASTIARQAERLLALSEAAEVHRNEMCEQAEDHYLQIAALSDRINLLCGVQLRAGSNLGDARFSERPAKVDGFVMTVLRDRVEISIGSDEGLKTGAELDVWRGATYVGRIVIRRTEPDRAIGDAIPAFRRSSPKRGDRIEFVNR